MSQERTVAHATTTNSFQIWIPIRIQKYCCILKLFWNIYKYSMEKLFWTKETLKKCRLFREQKWNVLKTKWKSIMEHNKMKCSQNKWRCSKKKYSELRNNNCFENKIKCFKKKHFEINVLEQIKIFYWKYDLDLMNWNI
jgi:hypothetical protein